jgi:hypothetical protein
MLTPSGPQLIEVNGRLGGDMIPYLGLLATGIEPGTAAAAVACGRTPDLTGDRLRVAAVRFFYVDDDDTTLASVEFDRSAVPATIDRLAVVAQPGAVVSPPPKGTVFGRIAYATASAGTAQECDKALDAAEAALSYRSAVLQATSC